MASLSPDADDGPGDAPITPSSPIEPSADVAACLERLSALGVVFQEIDPIDPGGVCPVAAPLEVTSLGSGVAITPKAILSCRAAEAFALWTRDAVIPAARTHLDSVPTEIAQASSYVCRSRNNEAGAKLSEHAKANAVDIGSIGFASRPPHNVQTHASDEPEGRFDAAIREGACKVFTTVLGPGSDAAHATHLHLDMAERSGGYRLCELGETNTAGPPP
ncbi:MAG: extensin family protein [Pseudomonadota bacterium]|nr:extensin family protein [Pseudomonadota bacterium]